MLDSLNPSIPILFYTILEREELDTDLLDRRGPRRTVGYARKVAQVDYTRKDEDDAELVEKIRQLLVAASHTGHGG